MSALYYTYRLNWIFIGLAYLKKTWVDMWNHSDTLFWLLDNQSLFLLLKTVYHAKMYKEVSLNANHIGGVIDSVLVSSVVDCVCKL
jgi:hypothetical protein